MGLIAKYDTPGNVKTWQQFLWIIGYPDVRDDGIFGPATEKATRAFQASRNLREDGIVGDGTLAAAKLAAGFPGLPDAAEIAAVITTKTVVEPLVLHPVLAGNATDKTNLLMLNGVAPTMRALGLAFIGAAKADGVTLRIVQGLRTFAEQDALFAKGRTTAGPKVTNARAGQSLHNYGLALDLAPIVNGKVSWDDKLFKPFGGWADAVGLEWGGRWKKFVDLPHVQYTKGMSLAAVRQLYQTGGLTNVWRQVA